MPLGGLITGNKTFFDDLVYNIQEKYQGVEYEKNDGIKLAQVLYVFKEKEKVDAGKDYTRSIKMKELQPNERHVRCLIRIPTLHTYLKKPTQGDLNKAELASSLKSLVDTPIPLYPLAVGYNIDLPTPKVGQYIWVYGVQNGENLLYVYVSSVEEHSKALPFGPFAGFLRGMMGGKTPLPPSPRINVQITKEIPAQKFNVGRYTGKAITAQFRNAINVITNYPYIIYDCTNVFGADRNVQSNVLYRDKKDIVGIVPHCTGCPIGKDENPMSGKSADYKKGTPIPDAVFSWKDVPTHFGVRRNGSVVFMRTVDTLCWHSRPTSNFTIAIEFEINPEGISPEDFYKYTRIKRKEGPYYTKYEHTELTQEQIESAHNTLLPFIGSQLPGGLSQIRYILSHRQSDAERQADPGHRAWKLIALEWMKKLNATDFKNGIWYYIGSNDPQCRCENGSTKCYCPQFGYQNPVDWGAKGPTWFAKRIGIDGTEIEMAPVSSCYSMDDPCYQDIVKAMEKYMQ